MSESIKEATKQTGLWSSSLVLPSVWILGGNKRMMEFLAAILGLG